MPRKNTLQIQLEILGFAWNRHAQESPTKFEHEMTDNDNDKVDDDDTL